MTNIFNKVYHVTNGTLVGNWYEEQALRDKTNEGRTIPAKHILKKAMDFDTVISVDPSTKDNTFDRIAGTRPMKEFMTTNSTYGDFSQPENKYKKIGIKEKIYNDFFTCYVGKGNAAHEAEDSCNDSLQALKEEEKCLAQGRESLRKKILTNCIGKGWLGFRKLKCFLKSLSKKNDAFIHKDDLKYFFVNFGICLEEREKDYVFSYFQTARNEINYEELLNSFITITEERMNWLHLFLKQLLDSHSWNKECMMSLIKTNTHPSVLQYKKTEKEILNEYASALESKPALKEDDFIQLFCEISICVQNDSDFLEMLHSCGFSYQN